MAYRYGEDRQQMSLFPQSIDEYVSQDHPVRAYDAFADTLDFGKLGIKLDAGAVGNGAYDPRLMLKLLLYGYSYGVRSSRKLERECCNNVTFMWLMKRLRPDHKTIAEFRRRHKKALKEVLKLCVQVCVALDLVDGNVLFVDGTKVRANAAKHRNHTREWYAAARGDIERRIEQLLEECEKVDAEEAEQGSLVKMQKDLASATRMKAAIEAALKQVTEEECQTRSTNKTVNLTDQESALMKGAQGSHASYNVQQVVDDKHGLIVNTDVVRATSDANQFANQVTQAEEVLGKGCGIACADAGYADTEELMKIARRGTAVIVPSQRQALRAGEHAFSKRSFRYDQERDCYVCPEGHILTCYKARKSRKQVEYQVEDASICQKCRWYGACTTSKTGRAVLRLMHEEEKEQLEAVYEREESQRVYKRRKEKVEHPFGHVKRNLGMTNFLLRGRWGAQAETALSATCFNIARLITLCRGVIELRTRLAIMSG